MGNFRKGHVNQEKCGHGKEYYQRPFAGGMLVGHSEHAGSKKRGHQNQRKVVIGCADEPEGGFGNTPDKPQDSYEKCRR